MNSKEIMIDVFDQEIIELKKVKELINDDVENIIEKLANCKGKVIIFGIGKSGIIGKKIAASMSSTGTNTVFVNAAEALHGDLGVIDANDICILLSNSGTSSEVVGLLPTISKLNIFKIAITGNLSSELALGCDYVFNISVETEACPLNLAPTTSTTALLMLGDALTVALMKKKNFKPSDFALYHPGGALGRKLLNTIENNMEPLSELTFIDHTCKLSELVEDHRLIHGIAFVKNNDNIVGVITDGDIRRAIKEYKLEFFDIKASEIMSTNFLRIDDQKTKLIDVLPILEERKVSSCPIFEKGKMVGLVKISTIYSIL